MKNQLKHIETFHLFKFLLKNSFLLKEKVFFDFYSRQEYKEVSLKICSKNKLIDGLGVFSFKQLVLFIHGLIISLFRGKPILTSLVFFLKLFENTITQEIHSLAFNKFPSILIAAKLANKNIITFEYQHGISNRYSYESNLLNKVLPKIRLVPLQSDQFFLKNLYFTYNRKCVVEIESLFHQFIYSTLSNNNRKLNINSKLIVYAHSPTGVSDLDSYIENHILNSGKVNYIKPHFNSKLKKLESKFVDDNWIYLNKEKIIIISNFSTYLLKVKLLGLCCAQIKLKDFPHQSIDYIDQIDETELL